MLTELLVGTKKGLFVLDGEPGAPFAVSVRAFAGEPVAHAPRHARTGRVLASVTSPFYRPKIWYADDPAGEWEAGADPARTRLEPAAGDVAGCNSARHGRERGDGQENGDELHGDSSRRRRREASPARV